MAEALGYSTQRRPRKASLEIEDAVALVRDYLAGLPKGSLARGRMPTHGALREAGRHDIRYALQARGTLLALIM